jgi:hypothetical protein
VCGERCKDVTNAALNGEAKCECVGVGDGFVVIVGGGHVPDGVECAVPGACERPHDLEEAITVDGLLRLARKVPPNGLEQPAQQCEGAPRGRGA